MPLNFFLFGPLGDPELLAVVLGRPVAQGELVAARAMRRTVLSADGAAEAVLVRADGEAAAGSILRDVSDADLSRIAFHAGDGAAELKVSASAAGCGEVEAVSISGAGTGAGARLWSPDLWRETRRAFDIEFARDWMSQFGRLSSEQMETRRAGIGFRAHSRTLAAAERPGRGTGLRTALDRSEVESLRVERPYMRFFSVEEHRLRHRKFDGSMSSELERAVFSTGDAVTILPYDPDLDRLLMIEQWRAGPWARGDSRPWCLEVVAGRIDPGEAPEATAIREAREEAGVTVTAVETIASFYATPGIAAERLTAYVGRADLSAAGGVHGLDSEDEDIRVLTPTFSEAMEMMAAAEVDNAPAIISLQWLAAQRERLREEWRT